MKINRTLKKMLVMAMLSALILSNLAACEQGSETESSFIPYNGSEEESTAIAGYDPTIDSSYATGSVAGETYAEADGMYGSSEGMPSKDTSVTFEENYNSYYDIKNNYEYNEYSVSENNSEVNVSVSQGNEYAPEVDECSAPEAEEPAEACEETEAPAEKPVAAPKKDHDYAEDAEIRTNEVLFNVKNPKVGATEATIRTEFTNLNGGTVTMAGCTVYDEKGDVFASKYGSSCYDEEKGFFEYDLKKDMGVILNRGENYYYQFVVEVNGELFTHKVQSFRTLSVDDGFAFELQDVKHENGITTISAKIFNPTGARVDTVGYRLTSKYGALASSETSTVDKSETEFVISYQLAGLAEDDFFGPDYDYNFFINFEGEKYESYMVRFTAPKQQ